MTSVTAHESAAKTFSQARDWRGHELNYIIRSRAFCRPSPEARAVSSHPASMCAHHERQRVGQVAGF